MTYITSQQLKLARYYVKRAQEEGGPFNGISRENPLLHDDKGVRTWLGYISGAAPTRQQQNLKQQQQPVKPLTTTSQPNQLRPYR